VKTLPPWEGTHEKQTHLFSKKERLGQWVTSVGKSDGRERGETTPHTFKEEKCD
jgi:hypothetical protein